MVLESPRLASSLLLYLLAKLEMELLIEVGSEALSVESDFWLLFLCRLVSEPYLAVSAWKEYLPLPEDALLVCPLEATDFSLSLYFSVDSEDNDEVRLPAWTASLDLSTAIPVLVDAAAAAAAAAAALAAAVCEDVRLTETELDF